MKNHFVTAFMANCSDQSFKLASFRSTTRYSLRYMTLFFFLILAVLLQVAAWAQSTPSIASVSPSVGPPSPVGPSVTIHGTNFGSPQGASTASFGGILVTPSSWNDTAIVVPVPSNLAAGNADIVVTVSGNPSNAQSFLVIPVITGISPGSAPVGQSVAISGAGFGATPSTVTFNGISSTPSSWTASSIAVPVPAAATTGDLIVTVNGIDTNQVPFTVLPPQPSISNISPTVGPPSPVGSSLTIHGANFGSSQGSSSVTIGGITANPSSWNNTTIVAPVPSSLPPGSADVIVSVNGGNSNAKSFFAIPVITGVSPNPASIGVPVTISGAGFGPVPSSLTFNGTTAIPSSWNGTTIVTPVPVGATTGDVIATINGFSTNAATLTVSAPLPAPPTITNVSPASGSAGTVLNITGANFGNTQNASLVAIGGGGGTASVSSWSDTAITVTVPNAATSGPLLVIVSNQVSNGVDFTVPPVISTLTPASGVAGTVITLSGTNFGASRGSSTVSLNGASAIPNTWSSTAISVPVPSGASTGDVVVTVNSVPSNPLTFVSNPTNGIVTSFRYDAKGQLISTTDPLNHTTSFTYTTSGGPTPAGLLQTTTDALNNVTQYQYDAAGNRTAVIDVANNPTAFSYDAMNRLKLVMLADNSTHRFAYDIRGRMASFTDGNGKMTTYSYDDADRLVEVIDANQGSIQYAYDSENNLVGITDPLNRQTTFTHDDQGHVLQTDFPSGFFETYAYDPVGNLISKTDRKHQTVTYSYDSVNRLTVRHFPDGTQLTYSYDLSNRLTGLTDPTGNYGLAYDHQGHITSTTSQYAFIPNKTFTATYGYDLAGNRVSFTEPAGGTKTSTYDPLNRLAAIDDSAGNHFEIAYDNLSRRTALRRPNGVNTAYSYDSVSNLVSVTHNNNAVIDGVTYAYDAVGNRTGNTALPSNVTSLISYDNLYRLVGVSKAGTTAESYTYDAVGNRLTSLGQNGYSYDNSNELRSAGTAGYTYDENGNTLTVSDTSGRTSFSWDVENRLTSATKPDGTVITFTYDPFGRRIRKNNTAYVYDSSDLVEELDLSGNPTARYEFTNETDEPLAIFKQGSTEFYEADGLGSITSLTSPSGVVVGTLAYDSSGNVTSSTDSSNQPFRFTGREFDSETGLYNYRARYYSATISRFLSEDPLGMAGGENFYPYASNDPVNRSDPFGLLDIYIWRYRGSTEAWGHASITLENTTHISWWPGDDRHPKMDINGTPIYEAAAREGQTLDKDIEFEGQGPDVVIHIDGMNEAAIQRWWDSYKDHNTWKTLSRNCSTTVYEALRAGGGPYRFHLFWSPSDVENYAHQILMLQELYRRPTPSVSYNIQETD